MGYQVGVTPLQMAAAVSAVANGGDLLEPRIVRAVVREGKRLPVPRTVVRKAITSSVAAEMTTMMEGVVERGTATFAQLPGYTIAGKTGTANKLVGGRYSGSEYNASFVGFVPSRNPVFTIVVVIDSPRGPNGHFGGPVSAPIFKRIADAALRQNGVPRSINPAPPVLVARREEEREQPVMGQPSFRPSSRLQVIHSARRRSCRTCAGSAPRDALRALTRLGLTARLNGDGVVVEQRPAPGDPVERAGDATLWLAREAPRRHAGQPEP
jgi:cell division protein FtsI (penicillin-binding protein 3)